jgi:hypothetical protein
MRLDQAAALQAGKPVIRSVIRFMEETPDVIHDTVQALQTDLKHMGHELTQAPKVNALDLIV